LLFICTVHTCSFSAISNANGKFFVNTADCSPYSDLFREFQKKLMQNNNILVTIGYSFSDEHINNLIFQAFTIPSFRLIIIGSEKQSETIEKLYNLDDSRIWIIGGKNKENVPNGYTAYFI